MANFPTVEFTQGGTLTTDDLVALANYAQLIENRTPRARDARDGANRDVGNKMMFGTLRISASKDDTFKKSVSFGNYFNSDCLPMVQITLRSNVEHSMWIRTFGLDGTNTIRSNGFNVRGHNYSANAKKKNGISLCFIDWVAFGF